MRLRYLSDAHGQSLRGWWAALQQETNREKRIPPEFQGLGRGDGARLRRAASIEKLETERATGLLVACLLRGEWKNSSAQSRFVTDPSALLMVAGVLAAVKSDAADGKSLAWRVGAASAKREEKVSMSELRFKRLLQARNLEDFFLLARRAVQLAHGTVDVAGLADDLLAWAYEQEFAVAAQRPAKSLCFRWAQDYYQPLQNKDAVWAKTEDIPEGEIA
jgi:CRISPR system Cascade subunit CasB